jgi:hypothetical protein
MAADGVTTWLAENSIGGTVLLRVGRQGDELVAEFANMGRLTTNPRGACVRFEPVAGASGAAVEKLRATVVDAFVRHAQGKVTFHGGAICLDSKVVALVGPSRSGKSTLTAALCGEPEIGLLGDDTVAIELSEIAGAPVEVLPTQGSAWLLPDARRAFGLDAMAPRKIAVPLRAATSKRVVLAAVVGLVFDSDAAAPRLRRLRGQEAFSTLFNSAFRFVIDDPSAQLREFDQLRVVVEKCLVYELRRPRDLGRLKYTVRLIRELLAGTHVTDGEC